MGFFLGIKLSQVLIYPKLAYQEHRSQNKLSKIFNEKFYLLIVVLITAFFEGKLFNKNFNHET